MPTPPTRISVTETASWATGGVASKSIASISWQIGDVLVAVGLAEGAAAEALAVPTNTGTGLSWASQKAHTASSDCAAQIAACVATAADSGVISMAISANNHFGFAVYIYRGSDGIGNSVEQNTTTQSVNLTPVAANSAIVWAVGDWSAEAAHTGTPTPTNTVENSVDSGRYTAHVFDLADQTSAGAIAYGVTGGGTTGPYTIVALEVKGAAAGSAVTDPAEGPVAITGGGTSLGFRINMPAEP